MKLNCTICGKRIEQGYIVENGLAFCCSGECLEELREAEALVDEEVVWADFEEVLGA